MHHYHPMRFSTPLLPTLLAALILLLPGAALANNGQEISGKLLERFNNCFQHDHEGPETTLFVFDGKKRTELKLDRQKHPHLRPGQKVKVKGHRKAQAAGGTLLHQLLADGNEQPFTVESITVEAEAQAAPSQEAPGTANAAPATIELSTLLIFANTLDTTTASSKISTVQGTLFTYSSNVDDAVRKGSYGHYGITHGNTVTVDLNVNATATSAGTMESLMINAATDALGHSAYSYDRIMVFCPPGTTGINTAYGYLGGKVTVYSHKWTTGYFDGFVHELGHNFGFHHSNKGSQVYGDVSCVMGFGHKSNGTAATFNPVKKFLKGWFNPYADALLSLSSDATVRLYPLHKDPETVSGAQAVSINGTGYKVAYRRNNTPHAKLWSSGDHDKVIVYSGTSLYEYSYHKQALAPGNTFTDSGAGVKVIVNTRAGNNAYATVTFDLPDGNAVPNANNQSAGVIPGTPMAITLTGNDADGDALSYSVYANPTNGTLSGTAPDLTYTPNPGFTGTDSFSFQVNDGNVDSKLATVTLNVDASLLRPTDLTAVPVAGGNSLDWSDNAGSETGYRVEVSTNATTWSTLTQLAADTTSYLDPAPAATSFYRVVVQLASGDGPASNIATVSPVYGEAGNLTTAQTGSGQWHTLAFSQSLAAPVAVLGPASSNDAEPMTVRARNVTNSGLEYQLDEWDYLDGIHGSESLSFLAVEQGLQVLPDGGRLMGGTANLEENWVRIDFHADFGATPVVLAQTASTAGSAGVTVRLQNVDATGFEIRLQEEEAAEDDHAVERVDWIAMLPGSGNISSQAYAAGRVTGVTDAAKTFSYPTSFAASPALVATMQTYAGGDPAAVRAASSTASGGSFFSEEEASGDTEVAHASETIGYLAFAPGIIVRDATNQPPVANDADASVDEDTSVAIALTAADPNGDPLAYSVVSQPTNGSLDGTAPNLTYTPDAGFFGSDSFTFVANDGEFDSNVATISITVNEVIPLVPSTVPDVSAANRIAWFPLDADVNDVDGNLVTTALGGAAVGTTPKFGASALGTAAGGDLVAIADSSLLNSGGPWNARSLGVWFKLDALAGRQIVYEEGGATRGFNVYVDNGTLYVGGWDLAVDGNDAEAWPGTWHNLGAVTTGQWYHAAFVLDATASPTTLSGSAFRAYLDGELAASGNGMQIASHGDDCAIAGLQGSSLFHDGSTSTAAAFTGAIDDLAIWSRSLSNAEVATLADTVINTVPVADDDTIVVAEDQAAAITLTGSDADGDPLTFSIVDAPANGTLSGTAPNLSYQPAANFAGADAFTFLVNDGTVDSSLATITITVTPVNDLPLANAGQDQLVVDVDDDGSELVTLDGSGSSDVEGAIVRYLWSVDGSIVADTADPAVVVALPVGTNLVQLTVEDADGATATDDLIVTVEPLPAIGESGTVTVEQPDSATWFTVTLQNSYQEPVVILGATTFAGGQPVAPRVRNVTATSFEFQIDEWEYLDGYHISETIAWLVVEAGDHLLPDGTRIVAGNTAATTGFSAVSYPAFAAAPVAFSQVVTTNDARAVTTRQRAVTVNGLELSLEAEEAVNAHEAETVAWVAVAAGTGTILEAATTADTVTHDWQAVTLAGTWAATPAILANMQTTDGGDAATLRIDNVDALGFDVQIDEEESNDTETDHTTEVVGYLAIAENQILRATQSQPLPAAAAASAATVYEDAEDGATSRWITSDAAARITNVDTGNGRVIGLFPGSKRTHFELLGPSGAEWLDVAGSALTVQLNADSKAMVCVEVITSTGDAVILRYGVGKGGDFTVASADGSWHTIQRDLAADLAELVPGAELAAVNGFFAYGTLWLDNVRID